MNFLSLDKLAAKEEQLPPAARAVAKSQRMLEFPVSSGNAHRQKVIIDIHFSIYILLYI